MKVFLVALFALSVMVANAQVPPDFSNWQNWEVETYDTTANEKPGFFSGFVDRLFEKVKTEAHKNIDLLQAQLDKLVNKFVSEVMFFSEFALMNAEGLERNAKAKLLLTQGTKSQECSQDYLPKLENAVGKGKKDLENCIVKAINEIASVKHNVQKYIDAISFEVFNLVDILQKCVNPFNPFSTTKCMLENTKNITSSISDMVSSAYNALKESAGEFRQIVSNTQACIKSTKNQTEINVKGVAGHIDECLQMTVTSQEHQ